MSIIQYFTTELFGLLQMNQGQFPLDGQLHLAGVKATSTGPVQTKQDYAGPARPWGGLPTV